MKSVPVLAPFTSRGPISLAAEAYILGTAYKVRRIGSSLTSSPLPASPQLLGQGWHAASPGGVLAVPSTWTPPPQTATPLVLASASDAPLSLTTAPHSCGPFPATFFTITLQHLTYCRYYLSMGLSASSGWNGSNTSMEFLPLVFTAVTPCPAPRMSSAESCPRRQMCSCPPCANPEGGTHHPNTFPATCFCPRHPQVRWKRRETGNSGPDVLCSHHAPKT